MANDTKYITLENLTRLANKIKADIRLKQDRLQFAELPDAAAYTGKVVQYTGEDTAELKAGVFYKSDGTAWTQVSVTETPEQNLVIVNQLPAWADADAGKLYAVKQNGVPYTTVYVFGKNDEGQILYPTGSNDPAVEVLPDNKMLGVLGPDVTEQNMPVGALNDWMYWLMPSAGFNEVYVPVPEGADMEENRQQIESFGGRIVNGNWYTVPRSKLIDTTMRMKVHVAQKVPTLNEAGVIYNEDKEADSNIGASMFIVTEPAKHSLAIYAKKTDETDAWYTVQTDSAAQPADLPTFTFTFTAISDADIEAAFEA